MWEIRSGGCDLAPKVCVCAKFGMACIGATVAEIKAGPKVWSDGQTDRQTVELVMVTCDLAVKINIFLFTMGYRDITYFSVFQYFRALGFLRTFDYVTHLNQLKVVIYNSASSIAREAYLWCVDEVEYIASRSSRCPFTMKSQPQQRQNEPFF